MLIYLALAAAVILADQGVKAWAAAALKPLGTLPLIKGVFHLTYTENTGAAFGLMSGGRWFFLPLTVVAVGVMIYLLRTNFFPTRLSRVAVGLVLGGAVGNFIDRLLHGFVVDMFEFRFINFAIFNVADMALTAGVGLLILHLLFQARPEARAPAAREEGACGESEDDRPA